MLSSILKSNHPFVIILIIFFGLGIWIYSFIDPVGIAIPADKMNMPFYEFIAGKIAFDSVFSILITFLLVLLQAFLLVQFNKRYILINYRTYLPAFFYVVIASSFIQIHRFNPVIIGTLFVFVAINFIYSTYRSEYALNKIFLAGFFISVASLLWAPFSIFFFIIWISLTILRPFIGREWIVGILGFLSPYLFIFVYFFVFLKESDLIKLTGHFVSNLALIKTFYSLHFSYYIFYGFVGLLILIASYVIVKNYQKKKIKTRKFFEINWWIFVICLVLFIFFKNVSYEIIYLISIPISFLLTDFFYYSKKSLYLNSILIILLGSLLYIQIIAH